MYLILGQKIADDHERAIRFQDQQSAVARGESVAGSGKIKAEWCEKCRCWHAQSK